MVALTRVLIGIGILGMLLPVLAADVAVDIGHTVEEPGASSATGVTELSFNQRLAGELSEQLKASGMIVRVINRDGKAPSLNYRTAQAAEDRFFISLHHDSVKAKFRPVTEDRFKGFSFWISETNVDYSNSLRCARAMADKMMASGFRPSHYHADPIYGESRPVIDWDRGIFSNRNLAVLRTARSAAVLVEAGVIAHPQEENRLADPSTQQAIAKAIAGGINGCLKP